MWEHLFARKDYVIGETYKMMREQYPKMKGNVMNSDDKLECLRIAAEFVAKAQSGEPVLELAKAFYNWVSEVDKPNSLTFEKINTKRK